ncbi:MAG: class I SAM-dependent methyltransferase [Candidatus Rokuibacteriota bacterium]
MIRSLHQRESMAAIHVLALDDVCARVLDEVLGSTIRLIRATTLHAYDPELAARRGGRSPWAFYGTHKPVLALFVMEGAEPPEALTYLDADLWFFDDLSEVFAEIGAASIGLSPHRFHEASAHLAIYGTYNAGCIYWRNDAIGRRSLADWRAECLEWCEERPGADGRFMNQGYLNRWPERYGAVHVVRNPGVNLGPWNLDGHLVERRGPRITVDGSPLVFYHFSGVVRADDGWYSWYPHRADRFEMAHEAIYTPYLAALEAEERMLMREYGLTGTASVRSVPGRAAGTRLRARPAPLTRDALRLIAGPTGSIPSFVAPDEANLDQATVAAFGREWERFGGLSDEAIEAVGDEYFADLLPADRLRGAGVLDVGCGSGRWAKYLARRAAFVDAADPSSAALVAARATAACANVRVIQASVASLPYAPGTFDVVVGVGVLHHVPAAAAAIARLAELVRPGGFLYLYLYYRLEGRPWSYRAAFQVAQCLRAVISRLPGAVKVAVCDVAALTIYLPLVALAGLVRRIAPASHLDERVPLHYYVGKPWQVIRNDALDRLGTPLERRFSRAEITAMLERSGLGDIAFGAAMPRWRVLARKPAPGGHEPGTDSDR